MRVRRARFVVFFCDDQPFVDIEGLLQGRAEARSVQQLYALPALTGTPAALTRDELDLVLSLPADRWSERDDGRLGALAHAGVVVADAPADERLDRLRRREEALLAAQWDLQGALFHFLTRWHDVDLRRLAAGGAPALDELPAPTEASLEAFVGLFGAPPPAFAERPRGTAVELPLVERSDGVFRALRGRRTTRSWDAGAPVSADELSLVLRYVFGAQAYAEGPHDIVILRRTSPSGGALHAVDPYLLVTHVEGLEPGLYAYDGHDHALMLRVPLPRRDAVELGTRFTCGQDYFGAAHVLFLLAARFERTFWKYRRHPKSYTVALMDAAHLSQTLYLVASELGLGAFATVAINAAAIDERLGLDGVRQGALAVLGCGRPGVEPSRFDPEFRPFVPRETRLRDSVS